MTDEQKPALSPAEWSGEESYSLSHASGKMGWFIPVGDGWRDGPLVLELRSGDPYSRDWEIVDRHALAALCLYQQPFGFTHRDLDDLELAAQSLDEAAMPANAELIRHIRARIAALLPPQP